MSIQFKQDINFLEYPLWMQDEKLASKSEDGFLWKDREGYLYRAGYKPPAKTDALFLYYFLLQSQKNGWNAQISLTRNQIIVDCGLTPALYWYNRLEESLERWKMVGIKFEGKFYDGQEYQTINFGIIDAWSIEKNTKKLIIRFSPEWLLKIKESNYFKYIDFENIKALRSPLNIRLYEILVKTFQTRNIWAIDAIKLGQKIPMNEKFPADITPKIQTAVNRINEHTNLKIKLTIKRIARGKVILIFEKLSDEQKAELLPMSGLSEEDNFKALIAILPTEHQNKKTILEAMSHAFRKHGFDYVKRNIQYSNKHCRNNYRAYLNKALKEDWGLAFKEDEDVKQKKREEVLKEIEEQVRRRNEIEQERQKEQEVMDTIVKYIDDLSSEELEALRHEATIRAEPETLKMSDQVYVQLAILQTMQAIAAERLNLNY